MRSVTGAGDAVAWLLLRTAIRDIATSMPVPAGAHPAMERRAAAWLLACGW